MEVRKLNMLRGLAALIVLLSHYSNSTNMFNGILGHDGGQFGVMLFFMLSGFLMSFLYIDKPFEVAQVRKYAIARFARVVPLFVLVVALSYVLPKIGLAGIFYDITDVYGLLSHLFLLSGNSVLWTIPPEIQFYFLFVLLWYLYAIKPDNLYIFIVVVYVSLALLNFPAPDWYFFNLEVKLKIFSSLQYFFAGIIFGQLYGKWQAPAYLRKHSFILVLFILPLLYPDIFQILIGYKHTMWRDAGIFFAVCGIFFALVFLVPDNNVILANRIGDYLGKISYSLYLLHLPVLYFLKVYAEQQPLPFLFVFILCAVLASSVSYYVIENPARIKLRAIL